MNETTIRQWSKNISAFWGLTLEKNGRAKMGAIAGGQFDWSQAFKADKAYSYTELIDTVLLVMEVAAKRIVTRNDSETFDKVHRWCEAILGQADHCLKTGADYEFLIKTPKDQDAS